MLPVLLFGSLLQVVTAQTFILDPSAIPGVTIAGRDSGQYPPIVDAVLGSARNQETNEWLPLRFVATNNSSLPIVGFAARWTITDFSDQHVERVLTRSLMESPKLPIAPGESVVLLPFWRLASHPGIRGSLDAATTALGSADLHQFENAQNVHATLDGVVFASGQFAGPNVANEFPYFQAEGMAGYSLASMILAKRDAGVASDAIVDWLRQEAAARAGGSLLSRDWSTAATAREAGVYLRVYGSFGESRMFAFAQQRVQGPHFTVHQ